MSGLSQKEQKLLIKSLSDQGCRVKKTTKGHQVYLPNGDILGVHQSESDRRGALDKRARVRRAGLRWYSEKTAPNKTVSD